MAAPTTGFSSGGFFYVENGVMSFDSADINHLESNGTLQTVIEHEMGHVLGFGTLWTSNGVYTDGSGEFRGANAVAAYQAEFNQPGATFVPVELAGGAGTANSHWDEFDNGGVDTGISDGANDMRYELMTGWLDNPTFLSETTVASFADIGYQLLPEPIPEPSTVTLLITATISLGMRRQRLRQNNRS